MTNAFDTGHTNLTTKFYKITNSIKYIMTILVTHIPSDNIYEWNRPSTAIWEAILLSFDFHCIG